MKLGVLSDTHGDVSAVQLAVRLLNRHGVEIVIHCGDVGTDVVPLLHGLKTHFVCGNMDDPDALRQAIRAPSQTLHEPLGILEVEGRRIAFLHGHDAHMLRHIIHSGYWDLVCHGHTHAFTQGKEGETVVLNPGAVSRTTQPSVAVVDLPSMEIEQIPL
jgi:uncharacterized protein